MVRAALVTFVVFAGTANAAGPLPKTAKRLSFKSSSVANGKKVKLPDGTLVSYFPGQRYLSAHFAFERPRSTTNSHIAVGDAELIHDAWLFGRTRNGWWVERWTPRAQRPSAGGNTLSLGGRVAIDKDWAVDWVGVGPGSMGQSGKRVMYVHLRHRGRVSDAWQLVPSGTRKQTRTLASRSKLAHVQIDVLSAKLAARADKSALTLQVRRVDRARHVAWRAPMPEGLYQLPDGLRLRWATSTMWVTYKAGDCRRRVYRAITLQRPGAAKTEHAGVPSKKQPLRRWGYTFSWDGKALHVRR